MLRHPSAGWLGCAVGGTRAESPRPLEPGGLSGWWSARFRPMLGVVAGGAALELGGLAAGVLAAQAW